MPKSLPKLPAPFVVETVLKRDIFGEIAIGHLEGDTETKVIRRRVAASARHVRRFAWHLANREITALSALKDVAGVPPLLGVDEESLYRGYIEGAPLHVAKPTGNLAYFKDAKRLMREIHRAGIAHNDLAKPQNWLITPDGRAALIDLQLAASFRRRGPLFRLMAREDLRHLLKQKRSFCRQYLTPSEKRMLATKSLPARIWLKTGKPVYNLVTRGIFNWSDGEGTKDRLDTEGKAIAAKLGQEPGVTGHVLSLFPYPKKNGVGIYAFIEVAPDTEPAEVERRIGETLRPKPDVIQAVRALPRDAAGEPREDLLRLIAINQVEGLAALAGDEAALAAAMAIADDRRNFTDRRL